MANTDKNSGWKKKYVIFLAGILVALITAYVALSILFGSWNPAQWKGSPEGSATNTEQQFQGDGGTQEKPGGNLSADNTQTKPGTDGDGQSGGEQSEPDDGTQTKPAESEEPLYNIDFDFDSLGWGGGSLTDVEKSVVYPYNGKNVVLLNAKIKDEYNTQYQLSNVGVEVPDLGLDINLETEDYEKGIFTFIPPCDGLYYIIFYVIPFGD